MRIAILGCGPAGLIAAQTAREHGASVKVFSKGAVPSYIAGTQYLHSRVPGVNDRQPDGYIKVRKLGTREGYAEKVYGYPEAPVSWDKYEEKEYPAWDMRALYERLWFSWGALVEAITLTPDAVRSAIETGSLGSSRFDMFLSTVPLKAICQKKERGSIIEDNPGFFSMEPPHSFIDQKVHIKQYEDGKRRTEDGSNIITYNGEDTPGWYRSSYIFGCAAYEWSAQIKKPPVEDLVTIHKPLVTNCNCYDITETPFVKFGRYGAWNKDALVHDVVGIVEEIMDERE